MNGIIMEKSQDKLNILKRIEEYEHLGYFDRDVEDDPPTRPLEAGEVDYLGERRWTRISSEFANHVAKTYFDRLIAKGELVIKEVRGIENYRAVSDRLIC